MLTKLIDQHLESSPISTIQPNFKSFQTATSSSSSSSSSSGQDHYAQSQLLKATSRVQANSKNNQDCIDDNPRTETIIRANNNKNNTNRFSCNELECLKERFVDFIKLDTATTTDTLSLEHSSRDMKSTEDEALMPNKAFPKSKSMQIYQENKSSLESNNDYQTFNQCKPNPTLKQISQMPSKNVNGNRYLSRLSVVSSEYSSAESSVSSSSSSSTSSNRPEPPQRTVSIRNSACIYSSASSTSSTSSSSISPPLSTSNDECYGPLPAHNLNKEDTSSIRSGSIYGTYRGTIPSSFSMNSNLSTGILSGNNNNNVRTSRSVFSIYEEEDETIHPNMVNNTDMGSNTTLTHNSGNSNKLERLTNSDIRRIESMYRSIGCIVLVSPCTCDLLTTTSEQIANLLNDCWNLEISSIVPVWLFDTGVNPKRKKQLRLLFVDRYTAFPIGASPRATTFSPILSSFNKPLLINYHNLPKNPDNDKRLTFTLNNKQLVCLIQFFDFNSCQDFFKFFIDLSANSKNADLFNQSDQIDTDTLKKSKNEKFSFLKSSSRQSQSLLSLSKLQNTQMPKKTLGTQHRDHRYSVVIEAEPLAYNHDTHNINKNSMSRLKSSQTWDNFKQLSMGGFSKSKPDVRNHQQQQQQDKDRIRITGITKNCISSPCAFQHINSIKDGDKRAQLFVDYKH